MVLNHYSPHSHPCFHFSSLLPPNNGALQDKCPVCPLSPNFYSILEDSPAFGCEEWREEGPLEEARSGQEGRRKVGGRRGGGERGMNRSGHSVYKGVRKRRGGRWVSEIREPGKKSRIWLGTFPTPEMAATAYDAAAFNLKTPYAYLNFPQHVSSLPILTSRSPKDIQEAAAAAASALRGVGSSTHLRRSGGLVPTPTAVLDDDTCTSSSTSTEQQQKQSISMETKAYSLIDEDMIFDMPNVLAHMAHGLMIAPPLHYLATPANADDNTPAWDCDSQPSIWSL